MSYNIIRGAEKQGGYVSMVEKGRVKGEVRTIRYICGLGSMTNMEFKAFQKWAHSIKDQDERMAKVLSSGRAIIEKEAIPERVSAAKTQRKTTVKQPQKPRKTRSKVTVRKHYPVPTLMGYKGRDQGKTHTEIMLERKKQRKIEYYMVHPEKEPKTERSNVPISKFTPEGVAYAKRSKYLLAKERVIRKRERVL